MGVTGFLPHLKDIQENISLEKYRGKTLAIDSYSWLHKSIMACSWELAQDLPTHKYVSYFKKRIIMLRHFGITPYFVFDGDDFISKEDTENERSQSRAVNKQKGLDYLQQGNKKLANDYFIKCADVTPSMAKSVIEYLKTENIDFVVAPYEADSQLVYLEKIGLVDGIISEDSDLLIFGAKALLTKLNDAAQCIEILRDNFKKCKSIPIGLMNDSQLRAIACLSGCDYTNGVPGIGVVKAVRLVKRLAHMKKCLMSLKLEGKVKIPVNFEDEYERADLSFQYQRVFDPITKDMTTLNEIKEQDQSNPLLEECIGQLYEIQIHQQIACGDLDPITKTRLLPREQLVKSKSQSFDLNLNLVPRSLPASITTTNPISTSKKPVSSPRLLLKTPRPKLSPKISSIDAFFNSQSTAKSSIIRSKSMPTPSLSPTSKRRKLFLNNDGCSSTNQEPVVSKFFKKTPETETNQEKISSIEVIDIEAEDIYIHENSPLRSKGSSSYSNIPPSSEFEFTDIDDDNELDSEFKELGDFDGFAEAKQPNTNNIMGDLNQIEHVSRVTAKLLKKIPKQSTVPEGLFAKFGFQNREPLKPINDYQNRGINSNSKLLANRNIKMKTPTLDSFMYRT